MPYIVALSGGIASGKSTVANLFAELGVPIIDADVIAKEVVQKGMPALEQIHQHFGDSILLPDGNLNRAMLRNLVFTNDNERLWLNQLLHPIIQAKTDELIKQSCANYILWVVPLLIENNLHQLANRVLIVDVDPKIQLQRVMQRDNIDENLAKNMLSSQLSREERLRYADDIIVNNVCLDKLKHDVNQLHNHYLQLAKTNFNKK
ncbi:dephospho-CoA kinase [Orbaceae bacterium ac157xtp]